MTVDDNTIQAETLGNFFDNFWKKFCKSWQKINN